jgi:hypothetical protein
VGGSLSSMAWRLVHAGSRESRIYTGNCMIVAVIFLLPFGRGQEKPNLLLRFPRLFQHLLAGRLAFLSIVLEHRFGAGPEPAGVAASTLANLQITIAEMRFVVFHLLSAEITTERLADTAGHLVAPFALHERGPTGRIRAFTGHSSGHDFVSLKTGIGQAPLLVGNLLTQLSPMGHILARDAVPPRTLFIAVHCRCSGLQDAHVGTLGTIPFFVKC